MDNPFYKISMCERPVVRGAKLDQLLLGKPLSHPFLVLKSDSEVLGEIHGTWERKAGYRQTDVAKFLELSIAVSSIFGAEKCCVNFFNKAALGQQPINVVRHYVSQKQFYRAVSEISICEGEGSVLRAWELAIKAADRITLLKIPYARYGKNKTINCQTTLRSVIDEALMPVPDQSKFSFTMPGW